MLLIFHIAWQLLEIFYSGLPADSYLIPVTNIAELVEFVQCQFLVTII